MKYYLKVDIMSEILLIKPPYPYGKPQIWMPTDLMKVASQLKMVGKETDIFDMNRESADLIRVARLDNKYDYVGIGVTGAPYIPVTKRLSENLLLAGKKVMLGGPGVEHLKREEFSRIYGNGPIQIKNDADLAEAIGVEKIPSVYLAGISDQMDGLHGHAAWEYLSKEISFFSSQGCKHSCRFCAAVRNDPKSPEKVSEIFSETISDDIQAIGENARRVDKKNLRMYISSLDLFQSPEKMAEVLQEIGKASKTYGIDFSLRGLTRVDSFLEAVEKYPELREIIPYSGLNTLGFGIDGTTDYVWKSQRKGGMSLEEAERAFSLCKEMGITPEALMVMGFNTIGNRKGDDKKSLKKNVKYAKYVTKKYGVVSRPHVAKEFYPGTEGWENKYWNDQKEKLFENIELFKNLDFVAYASEITHPDPKFRKKVNKAYKAIIDSLGSVEKCATSPLMPYKSGDKEWNLYADRFNMESTFDR